MTSILGRMVLIVVLSGSASIQDAQAHDTAAPGAKATLVYQHELPNAPGKSLKAVLVEYEPGAGNPAHRHAPSAFIYATVLEGTIKSQVNGGELRIYRKGESFTELPGSLHNVSANGSPSEPAKLLAVFVVDTGDTVLTTPVQ